MGDALVQRADRDLVDAEQKVFRVEQDDAERFARELLHLDPEEIVNELGRIEPLAGEILAREPRRQPEGRRELHRLGGADALELASSSTLQRASPLIDPYF